MAKQRTVFEEIKYLKGRIARAERACRELEAKLPEAQRHFEEVAHFENSEDREERKAFIFASFDLASIKSDLAKKRTDIIFDTDNLEKLLQMKAEVEAEFQASQPE